MSNNSGFDQTQMNTHLGGVNIELDFNLPFSNRTLEGGTSIMLATVIRRRQIRDTEMTSTFGPKWPQIEAFLNRLTQGVSVSAIPELCDIAGTDKFKDARDAAEMMAHGYGRGDQMRATTEAARLATTNMVTAIYLDGEPEGLNKFVEGVALAIMLADLIVMDGVADGPFKFDQYLALTRHAENLNLCAELDFGGDTSDEDGSQFDLDMDHKV